MRRRELIAGATGLGSVGLAGCLGILGGGGVSGTVQNNLNVIKIEDLSAGVKETEQFGKAFVVTGVLHNTHDAPIDNTQVKGRFFDSDGVQIGSDGAGTIGSIPAGGRVKFRVGFGKDPDAVAEYKLTAGSIFDISAPVVQSGNGTQTDRSGTTQTETKTENENENETATPEPPDVSFVDTFEEGTLGADPTWFVNSSSYADEGMGASVVEESAPDGGNRSLSMRSQQYGLSVKTERTFRWDYPWTVSGLYKATWETPLDGNYTNELELGPVTIRLGFYIKPVMGPGGETRQADATILADTSSNGIAIDWRQDTWYRYECRHDGEGTFQLKVWAADESEPDEYQTTATASPSDSEAPLVLDQIASTSELDVRHARIAYEV